MLLMIKELSLNILKPYINKISQRCSFLYGIDTKLLVDRMNKIKEIKIDNLPNYVAMQVSFNNPESLIIINSSSCRVDSKGNLLSFVTSATEFEERSLIHELLHVAAKGSVSSGLIDKSSSVDYTGLNEGITEMLTDDICGYTESKYMRSYNEMKIFAKILRVTFGNDIICESYFKNNKLLKEKFFELTKDKEYYNDFNIKLSALNIIIAKEYNSADKSVLKDIYSRKVNYLLNDLIINIVIPYIKKLNPNEKNKYINNLFLNLSGDEAFSFQVKNMLLKYINISDNELDLEKKKLVKKSEEINTTSFIYEEYKEIGNDYLKKLFVSRDGKIYLLGKINSAVTSTILSSMIYKDLYYSSNPELSSYIFKLLIQIDVDNYINIPGNDILERRKLFCAIKWELNNCGFCLANDYRELDNTDTIKNPIILPNKVSKLGFSDMKILIENFYVSNNESDKNETRVVKFRSNGFIVEDEYIKKIVLFAYDWFLSCTNKEIDDEEISDIESIDDKTLEDVYLDVINALKRTFYYTNNLNIEDIQSKCEKEKSKQIILKLLNNPTRCEWVHEFLDLYNFHKSFISNSQGHKEKSYSEIINENYVYENANNITNEILKR